LPECRECGTEVESPFKTWSVSRKTSNGETKTVFGMFECPECGNRFRAGVKNSEKKELSIKGVAEKIKGIEGEFMNTLKNLREKLKTLETERANLLVEIDELKKMAEAKANALESEIGMLREEVKSLKQLLGVGEMDTEQK
jgi:predicted RNase H-like nuclease (RuvC/YqgF family)